LLRELSQSLNVCQLLKNLGVERAEGESIRLTPIGIADRIVSVRYKGTEYRLNPAIPCNDWRENYGPLERK